MAGRDAEAVLRAVTGLEEYAIIDAGEVDGWLIMEVERTRVEAPSPACGNLLGSGEVPAAVVGDRRACPWVPVPVGGDEAGELKPGRQARRVAGPSHTPDRHNRGNRPSATTPSSLMTTIPGSRWTAGSLARGSPWKL